MQDHVRCTHMHVLGMMSGDVYSKAHGPDGTGGSWGSIVKLALTGRDDWNQQGVSCGGNSAVLWWAVMPACFRMFWGRMVL